MTRFSATISPHLANLQPPQQPFPQKTLHCKPRNRNGIAVAIVNKSKCDYNSRSTAIKL